MAAAAEVRQALDHAAETLRGGRRPGGRGRPHHRAAGGRVQPVLGGRLRQPATLDPPRPVGRAGPGLPRLAETGLSVGVEEVLQAEAARARLWRQFAELYRRYDLVLTPTTPDPAPPVETVYHGPGYSRWRAVGYVLPFNLTGQPAADDPLRPDPGRPAGGHATGRPALCRGADRGGFAGGGTGAGRLAGARRVVMPTVLDDESFEARPGRCPGPVKGGAFEIWTKGFKGPSRASVLIARRPFAGPGERPGLAVSPGDRATRPRPG